MLKNASLLAVAALVYVLASTPSSYAGTEMVEPKYAPSYNYAPPPPPLVYVVPPPPPVVVYPVATVVPRVRVFAYQRVYVQRPVCRPHRWR